jgi:hypothetical protein
MMKRIVAAVGAAMLVTVAVTVAALAYGEHRVVSATGSGSTQTLACATAKSNAFRQKTISEELVSYGYCQCSNTYAGTSYPPHWVCNVDATMEDRTN